MPHLPLHAVAAAAALLLAAPALLAQTAPDAGQLLRDANRTPATPPTPLPQPPKPQAAGEPGAGPRVQVSAFRLSGVTLVPEADVQARLAPFVGQAAALADLRRAADAVADLYAERGYLVRAYLPEQALQGGVVSIAVLEGRLGGLRVEQAPPGQRIGEAQVRQMMTARQQLGEPVRSADIQRAIALLNALPGISATSLLEPGEQSGESRLVVAVKDEALVTGQVQLDNAGSQASGEWRASGGVSFNSPSGRGDQAQLFASKSRGSAYGSAAYSLPLGADGLRANVNGSHLNYGYTLSGSRYNGSASVLGAAVSYPVVREAAFNLNANAALDHKTFTNDVAGIQLNDKSIRLATFTLAGDVSDRAFGGGLTQFALAWGRGRLDLAGNAGDLAADQTGPQRQGAFGKLGWQLARLQRITEADTLALSWSGQRAQRNLDSAEKFGATGSSGVRAYSSSEPSADDGQLLSIEWRRQVTDKLSVAAYHDRASLQRDHRENSATLSPNHFTLAGTGIGVSWGRANELLVRGGLAWRQGENPVRNVATGADSDGTHRNPRLYVSLLKIF